MDGTRIPVLSAQPEPAQRLDAPQSDMVFRAKASVGLQVDLPGYTAGLTVGISTSTKLQGNSIYAEVSHGIGGGLNLDASSWRQVLVALPLQPSTSIGGEFDRTQTNLVGISNTSTIVMPYSTLSPPQTDGAFSWSVSTEGMQFGVRDEKVLRLEVNSKIIEGGLKDMYDYFERLHRQALEAVGYPSMSEPP